MRTVLTIILLLIVFLFGFILGCFLEIAADFRRICGNFLIDDTDPDKTIYRIELTRDIKTKFAIFEIKHVDNLESANETGFLMKEV